MFRKGSSAQPTHGWLIGNKFLRYMAWAFMASVFVWFVLVWTVTYTIRRNCQEPYQRDLGLFGYWIHIDAGSKKEGCPQP